MQIDSLPKRQVVEVGIMDKYLRKYSSREESLTHDKRTASGLDKLGLESLSIPFGFASASLASLCSAAFLLELIYYSCCIRSRKKHDFQ